MLNELAKQIHNNAKNKGFYESEKNIGEILCLIHSELSKALEADRKGRYSDISYFLERQNQIKSSYNDGTLAIKQEDFVFLFKHCIKDTFEDELADVVIRILDLCAFKGIDLENHIKAKIRYNSSREHKHGKAY